jgi:hypothetical protein
MLAGLHCSVHAMTPVDCCIFGLPLPGPGSGGEGGNTPQYTHAVYVELRETLVSTVPTGDECRHLSARQDPIWVNAFCGWL